MAPWCRVLCIGRVLCKCAVLTRVPPQGADRFQARSPCGLGCGGC